MCDENDTVMEQVQAILNARAEEWSRELDEYNNGFYAKILEMLNDDER